jgi:hypothetical protein
MSTIEILGTSKEDVSLSEFEKRATSLNTLGFFAQETVDFCDQLSRELMLVTRRNPVPELIALAFWLRKSELLRMKSEVDEQKVYLPRGMAFHIPPANVDTIFIYSWVLSILCGNSNIIRLSRRTGESAKVLLNTFFKVLERSSTDIKRNSLFIHYAHDLKVLTSISSMCDLRLVWGGDHSINEIRKVPVRPRALDIGFADRFSFSLLSVDAVSKSSEAELSSLCEKFYNDSYVFNQKACSSPKVILWLGDYSAVKESSLIFFTMLKKVIVQKSFIMDESLSMFKLKKAYGLTQFDDFTDISLLGPEIINVEFNTISSLEKVRGLDAGGGIFFSTSISDLAELTKVFTQKDQTLTYFGINKDELVNFARNLACKGIDRIVPVGSALNFNETWDGTNLIQLFSREVYVE